mgnify:CR=1 FL=1
MKGYYLRLNSESIRERLRKAGFSICVCAEFKDAVWLHYIPGVTYDIHGIGYLDNEIPGDSVEFELACFLKINEDIDCDIDVEHFIKCCKQIKEQWQRLHQNN